MDILIILARIIHIFSAVLWAGGGLLYFLFIEPAIDKTMPASQKFTSAFMGKFSPFMGLVSVTTVLAGAVLFWHDSAGLQLSWIGTPTGLGFSLGATVGIATALFGFFVVKPRAERLGLIGAQLETQGRPPTTNQLAEIGALTGALKQISRIDFIMLTLALLFMATARYW